MKAYVPAWQSMGHLLREQAGKIGGRRFLRFEGQDITFAEFEARTNRLANVLAARGVRKGDRVSVMIPNSLDFPTAWFAIAKLGAVMVPTNTGYRERDLEYILNDSGAIMALCGVEQADMLRRVQPDCPALRQIGVMGADDTGSVYAEMERASDSFPIDNVQQGDLVNIQYTSGTTGFPKGCMLTHEYWLMMGQNIADFVELNDRDVVLTAQPYYYIDPQWNTILCLILGIPLVVLPRFSASTFWQSIKENGVTFFYVLGTMPIYLLKQPENPEYEKNHQVRRIVCSGIVPQLHRTFEERWNAPWREGYGMTESGGDLFVPFDDTDSVGSGAMGKPIPTKEAKIVGEDGRELPDGEVGEMIVRGKPMMLGYWNKPEATAQTIRDGWLHTGDLAYRDAKGYFYLVGRLKDMIRRTGENISAVEVESVLNEHPAVRASAVVAVPDELRGEEVKAFIQLQPGHTPDTTPPQAILDFARGKLAAFKVPRFIEYVDDFPLTPSERIAKHELLKRRADQRQGAYDAQRGK